MAKGSGNSGLSGLGTPSLPPSQVPSRVLDLGGHPEDEAKSSRQEKSTTLPAPVPASLRWYTVVNQQRPLSGWRRGGTGYFWAEVGPSHARGEKLVFSRVIQGEESEGRTFQPRRAPHSSNLMCSEAGGK